MVGAAQKQRFPYLPQTRAERPKEQIPRQLVVTRCRGFPPGPAAGEEQPLGLAGAFPMCSPANPSDQALTFFPLFWE